MNNLRVTQHVCEELEALQAMAPDKWVPWVAQRFADCFSLHSRCKNVSNGVNINMSDMSIALDS